jgi:hypothetical protein
MSIKRFCDFCGEEIGPKNSVQKDHFDYSYTDKKWNESTHFDIKIDIDVRENKKMDVPHKRDICKDCLKELVEQM